MPRRIDAGEILAALGGLLVFVSLFLLWFGDLSGWEAFEALDLVIALLALLAVAAAVNGALGRTDGPSPRLLPAVGLLLVAIVAVQLVEPPPLFGVAEEAGGDVEREIGAWLALLGSLLVLLGGILRLSQVSVTVSVGGRDPRKRVPAVDRRPAAPAPVSPTQRTGGPVGTGPEGGVAGAGPAAEEAVRRSAPDGDDQRTQAFNALDEQ